MPGKSGYENLFKASKGTEKKNAQALVDALRAKGYAKERGGEKMLTKFTMGGGDLLGAMVAAQPRPSVMKDGGEEYYKLGGQTGRSTYSGKKKKKKKK